MLNHTLKAIRNFFVSGKKKATTGSHMGVAPDSESGSADQRDVRMFYHNQQNGGLSNTLEAKPEAFQHDWWIN